MSEYLREWDYKGKKSGDNSGWYKAIWTTLGFFTGFIVLVFVMLLFPWMLYVVGLLGLLALFTYATKEAFFE